VSSREPSSAMTHSQRGSFWRAMLRRQAGSVLAASNAGRRTEIREPSRVPPISAPAKMWSHKCHVRH
jgi:hypothetical protein